VRYCSKRVVALLAIVVPPPGYPVASEGEPAEPDVQAALNRSTPVGLPPRCKSVANGSLVDLFASHGCLLRFRMDEMRKNSTGRSRTDARNIPQRQALTRRLWTQMDGAICLHTARVAGSIPAPPTS